MKDEEREEVLYIIYHALEELESKGEDNKFMIPNGSLWTYEEVREYLENNLR